jgi:hypothetical protein
MTMVRLAILLVLLAAGAGVARATRGGEAPAEGPRLRVAIAVHDAVTRIALPGATIELDGRPVGRTDGAGRAVVWVVPAPGRRLVVRAPGYATSRRELPLAPAVRVLMLPAVEV